MNKDMKKYMTDSEESFGDFMLACDDLINSKYILAEGKIAALLQKIAISKPTYALFESVLKGFDFNYEFKQAKRRTANGGETVVMPLSARKTVALVFCLLLDFDTRRYPLRNFLHAFFYSDNTNWEYSAFVKDVLVPFREAVQAVYEGRADEEEEEQREDVSDGEESDADDIETLFTDLSVLSDKVLGAPIEGDDYDEAVFTLNGLSRALSSADRDGIRLAYIAFRNTVSQIEELDFLADDIAAFSDKLVRLGAIPVA